jgi:hypothetical protein
MLEDKFNAIMGDATSLEDITPAMGKRLVAEVLRASFQDASALVRQPQYMAIPAILGSDTFTWVDSLSSQLHNTIDAWVMEQLSKED